MPNFYECNPEQAYLLPPSVKDVLGENRMPGLAKVVIEFTLAATALNLTRIWRVNPQLRRTT